MVDHHPHRLRFAQERYGAIPINFDDDNDAAEKIIEQNVGQRGVDVVIDAVGFEAKGSTTETILSNLKIEGSSGKALRQCIAAVRRGGVVSVPGVRTPVLFTASCLAMPDKGLSFKMGQTHVHAWLESCCRSSKRVATPEDIVTHYLPLADAERDGVRSFENGRRSAAR